MTAIEHSARCTFGLFEADFQAEELWKAGFRVRLPGQAFKILTILLSKAGELVTREELQRRIWGGNTNVDFERALAGAINKIRDALGDSADNPRFIETLPKRGYRFIAPVAFQEPVPFAGAAPALPMQKAEAIPASVAALPVMVAAPEEFAISAVEEANAPAKTDFPTLGHRALPWIAIAAALIAVLAVVFLSWPSETAPIRVEQLTRNVPISTGPPNPENLITLATDGDRILTSVMDEGKPRLSAIYLSTGEVQTLQLPRELDANSLADISKDGSKLLLRSHLTSASEQPLWVVPSSGGSASRVGGVLAHDAAWMPDGTSILYANGNDLAVIRLGDGVSLPYAKLNGRAFWLRWSPDGTLLRFTLMDPLTHTSSLWELKKGSKTPKPVRTPERLSEREPHAACCGTWTADGSAYVFQSGGDLWELKGAGRTAPLVQLTNGPLQFASPVPARAGSRIFFLGLDQPSGLQVFDGKDGFHPAPAFLGNTTRADYSRDGAWVAWTDSDGRLWRARAADGSDKVRLTPDYLEAFLAHWSPDGKRLAVMGREPGKVWQTYLIDAAGGTPQHLLSENRNAADPGWSADGTKLVFGREPDLMGKESGPHTIEILDLRSGRTEVVPGSEGLFSPRWSPDGRWIAALTLNQESLMLYDLTQRQWKPLAAISGADPVWSADSRAIYMHAFMDSTDPILKVNVPDGTVTTIADLSAFHNRNTVNYFFGGLTPANQPLVVPQVGTGNLYTLDLKQK